MIPRSKSGLIVFVDLFLVLLFVLASKEDIVIPSITMNVDFRNHPNQINIVKVNEEGVYVLDETLKWQFKYETDSKTDGFEHPLYLDCGSYCKNIGVENYEGAIIVLSPPISDDVSYAYTKECFSDIEHCKGMEIVITKNGEVKVRE